MKYCVILGCQQPHNSESSQFCQYCGSKLLLRERYRPIQPISRGGFGRTFLAIDEDLPSKPRCVVKQLCLDKPSAQQHAQALQLFHKEAERLDELGQHGQIPSLFAHFQQNRLFYLVQEFVDGVTLEQELAVQGTYSGAEVRAVLLDLLATLAFVHQRNIIHRDLKPSNIIRRSRDRKLVLIDFGIAKVLNEATALRTGTIIGTAEYMAPEQNRGRVFPASDLYSIGAICVRLLTGQSPFDAFDVASHQWMWRDRLPPSSTVDPALGKIIDKLLQEAVNQRYQTVADVLHALSLSPAPAAIAPPAPAAPTPPAPTAPTVPPSKPSGAGRLASAAGIHYQPLQRCLAARQWEKADTATWNAIRTILNKPPGGYIFSGDLRRLPCADLQTLDRLWTKYSLGRFGFTAQSRIYEAVGEDYRLFCEQVGWPLDNRNDRPNHWHFNSLAPPGHLPSRLAIGGQQWWQHGKIMAEKLTECHN